MTDYPDFFISRQGVDKAADGFNAKIRWYTDREIPFEVKFHYEGENFWTGMVYPRFPDSSDKK